MNRLRYFTDCVNWPGGTARATQPGDLCDMVSGALQISRRTFMQHVERGDLAAVEGWLGYERHQSQGLTMAGDYHVSYHRGTLHGVRVYFFKWSSIEHVFTPGGVMPRPINKEASHAT